MLKPNIGTKSLIIMLLVCLLISSGCKQNPAQPEDISIEANATDVLEEEDQQQEVQQQEIQQQGSEVTEDPKEELIDGQYDFYLQQVQNKSEELTDNTKIFFNKYYRANMKELWLLPPFVKGKTPNWDELTLFIMCNTPEDWQEGYISEDFFADTVTKYFGDIKYTHKSGGPLDYKDGKYTPAGLSFHGGYSYELTKLAKGQTVEGKDSWEAWITGYYFSEMDGDPNEPDSSDNAKAIYAEMEKEEYQQLDFYEMCNRMMLQNPRSVLKPAVEWHIEFIVNDPLGKINFTYLSCEKKEYPMP